MIFTGINQKHFFSSSYESLKIIIYNKMKKVKAISHITNMYD